MLLHVSINGIFFDTIAQLLLIDTSVQNDSRLQMKKILSTCNSKRTMLQKLPRNQLGKLSPCARGRWFFERSYVLMTKKKGKSKDLLGRFCFDSGTV